MFGVSFPTDQELLIQTFHFGQLHAALPDSSSKTATRSASSTTPTTTWNPCFTTLPEGTRDVQEGDSKFVERHGPQGPPWRIHPPSATETTLHVGGPPRGVAAMGVLTMFYVDAMTRDYEAIDNDGDSYDWDGDGYPNGQENLYGTDIFDAESHPGILDASILPDDPSVWINEDDFDWDALQEGSVGVDDNGDCNLESRTDSQKDANRNGIPCDIELVEDRYGGGFRVLSDGNVDEDPMTKPTPSRPFTGVSSSPLENWVCVPHWHLCSAVHGDRSHPKRNDLGTMHFMLAKPIARGRCSCTVCLVSTPWHGCTSPSSLRCSPSWRA